jgi:hypothetical protein
VFWNSEEGKIQISKFERIAELRNTSLQAVDVKIAGDFMFVLNAERRPVLTGNPPEHKWICGVEVWDISNPGSLTNQQNRVFENYVGFLWHPNLVLPMAMDVKKVSPGNYIIIVGDDHNGVFRFNFKTSGISDSVGYFFLDEVHGVKVLGNYAYLANYYDGCNDNCHGFAILDISSVSNFEDEAINPVGTYYHDPFRIQRQIYESVDVIQRNGNTYAFIVETLDEYCPVPIHTTKLRILDVTNPAAPTIINSSIDTEVSTYDVKVVGDYAYLANGLRGFTIINVANVNNPFEVSTTRTVGTAKGIEVYNDTVFIADDLGVTSPGV